MRRALLAALGALFMTAALPADAARKRASRKAAAPGEDPARWFATRTGLIRVYQVKSKDGDDEPVQRDGASCEVLESRPAAGGAAARTRELCTTIVARKTRRSDQLTYELRESGIFMVSVEQVGSNKPARMERLLLPGRLRVGASWREPRGPFVFDRRVKSCGAPCDAAGFKFGDCLVVEVMQRKGTRILRRFTETYAAGVGLVEDSQVQLVDVKGL